EDGAARCPGDYSEYITDRHIAKLELRSSQGITAWTLLTGISRSWSFGVPRGLQRRLLTGISRSWSFGVPRGLQRRLLTGISRSWSFGVPRGLQRGPY